LIFTKKAIRAPTQVARPAPRVSRKATASVLTMAIFFFFFFLFFCDKELGEREGGGGGGGKEKKE